MSVQPSPHSPTNPLQVSSLLDIAYQHIQKIKDPRKFSSPQKVSLTDILMSGLAVFSLKFPSLLEYDRKRKDSAIENNLKTLYHVQNPPSDTYMRERLDEIDPSFFRPIFKKIFAKLQRTEVLEKFQFLDGHYLLSIDGTGHFSSSNVSCPNCCVKKNSNGTACYYHQMLAACIVHPNSSGVIPLCPEAIINQDGSTKNDCEQNASKRLLENFRREHPHLKTVVVQDALFTNGPYIKELIKHKISYILGIVPSDNVSIFKEVEASSNTHYFCLTDQNGYFHQFRYVNNLPLNKTHADVKVNFLEYRETDPKGNEKNFSWVTDILITEDNVCQIMRGGRSRWRIENETFNTLKTMGYNFEHNYGHGKQNLATNFCLLMLIAFLIDQAQGMTCKLFQSIKKLCTTFRSLWETMRVLFQHMHFPSWGEFYHVIGKNKFRNST